MTKSIQHINRILLFILFSTILLITEVYISKSMLYQAPYIPLAVVFDVIVIIPIMYYFFLVRPSIVPKFTIWIIFLASIASVSFLMPEKSIKYLNLLYTIIPLIEVFIIGFALFKIKSIVKQFKVQNEHSMYISDSIIHTLEGFTGSSIVINILASEISFIYFSIVGWFKIYVQKKDTEIFTYTKTSNYKVIVIALVVATLLGAIGTHFIVNIFSSVLAWIITISTLYLILYMLGDVNAAKLQPMVISKEIFYLRVANRQRVDIPLDNIMSVKQLKREHTIGEKKVDDVLELYLLNEANIEMTLENEVLVNGLLGSKKVGKVLAFYVDEPYTFVKTFEKKVIRSITKQSSQ